MNVYKVTLSCMRHFGNGHMTRESAQPQTVIAADGDKAVEKAKKAVDHAEPILEELERIVVGAK